MSRRYLSVTAKPKNGIRRAGFRFGATAQQIDIDDLSAEQIEMLKGDGNLVVHEVDDGEVLVPSTADTNALKAAKIELHKAQGQLEEVSQERDAHAASLTTATQKSKDLSDDLDKANQRIAELEVDIEKSKAALTVANSKLETSTGKKATQASKAKTTGAK